MPIQKITAVIGAAKQASAGTLTANATHAHGLMGGSPVQVEPQQSALEVTAGRRASYNVFREHVNNGADIQAPAYMRSLGLWLLGAMGTETVTGSNPYVHTYSTGDLPYLSVFSRGIGSTNQAIRDCKVDELSLKWDGSKPVELSVKAVGTVFSYPASIAPTAVNISQIAFSGGVVTITTSSNHGLSVGQSFTVSGATAAGNNGVFTVASVTTTTVFTASNASGVTQGTAGGTISAWADETGSESFLVPVGGTFSLDSAGSTPVSARVISGELNIKNNISPIDPSSTIESADVWEGVQEHTLKLTIVPDDLAEFRKTVTGSAAGTSVAAVAPIGSVSLTFRENNGSAQLVVTGSKVAFLTSFPDADPKGGAVELELAGIAVMPASGTAPLVYALTNAQNAY